MMEDVDFTDDEISKELADLGYDMIPAEQFRQFKKELFDLIRHERSVSSSSSDASVRRAGETHSQRGHVTQRGHKSAAVSCHDERLAQFTLNSNKENVNVMNSQFTQRQQPVEHSDTADDVTPSATDRSEDGPTRYGDVVLPDRRAATNVSGRPDNMMKRKTLRRCGDGQVSVSESFTESETVEDADVASLEQQLRHTALMNSPVSGVSTRRPASAPPCVVRQPSVSHTHRSHTACRQPTTYNLPGDYSGPKSLIRPMSCEPHVQHIKKSDPVSRYQSYRHSWDACRAPGEKSHKRLRWGVREKMLYHDQKAQRCYRANSYMIPSDKKRKTLRWQIRMDLAQGVKPPSAFD